MTCRLVVTLLCTLALGPSCGGDRRTQLVLVTTTSVGNAGLLDALLPRYEREHDGIVQLSLPSPNSQAEDDRVWGLGGGT